MKLNGKYANTMIENYLKNENIITELRNLKENDPSKYELLKQHYNLLKFKEYFLNNNYFSYKFKLSDPSYFEKSYEERAVYLGCPSKDYLYLSNFMVNKNYSEDINSEYYPKFVVCLLPFIKKIHKDKLIQLMKKYYYDNEYKNPNITNKKYNFRVSEETDFQTKTQFEHNSLCPVLIDEDILIIIDSSIYDLKEKYIWMGGGDVNTKLRLDIKELVTNSKNKILIGDYTIFK